MKSLVRALVRNAKRVKKNRERERRREGEEGVRGHNLVWRFYFR